MSGRDERREAIATVKDGRVSDPTDEARLAARFRRALRGPKAGRTIRLWKRREGPGRQARAVRRHPTTQSASVNTRDS